MVSLLLVERYLAHFDSMKPHQNDPQAMITTYVAISAPSILSRLLKIKALIMTTITLNKSTLINIFIKPSFQDYIQ